MLIYIAVEDPVNPFALEDLERARAEGFEAFTLGDNEHVAILGVPIGKCDSKAVNAIRGGSGHSNITRRRDIRWQANQ